MCQCGPGGMSRHQMGLSLPGNVSSAVIPHRTPLACSVGSCNKERKTHARPSDMTAGSHRESGVTLDKYHGEDADVPSGQATGQLQVTKEPFPLPNCDTPTLHGRGSSLPPDGAASRSSLQEYGEKTKDSSKWLGFMGGFRGSGCSVVLDKSADLIELTDESVQEENELCRSASCSCTTATQTTRKWLFSHHKCKSLDCTSDSVQIFRVPSRQSSLVADFEKPKSTDCSLSTVYSGMSAGPSCPDIHRPNGMTHCDSEADVCDEEFRGRSFSLTPTVNLAVFETESSSECEDILEDDSFPRDTGGTHCQMATAPLLNRAGLPCSPSAAQLSLASSATWK